MGRRTRSLITCLILVIQLAAPIDSIAQSVDVPQALVHQEVPCPMALPLDETEGQSVVCGQIEVPENWDQPTGTTILVTYAVVKARNAAPFADPILYFDGGPGASSLEVIGSLSNDLGRLRETRDVVFWDQRGVRFSGDLVCPPEATSNLPAPEIPEGVDIAAIEETLGNISLASDPVVVTDAFAALPNPIVTACAAYFADRGIDLSQYSTHNSVRDAIALMGALGYPAYNLYGISYGTTLAQEVLRYYDQHAGAPLPALRAMVIDGVMPMTADFTYNNAMAIPNVVLQALADCEADAACAANYPNIRERAIRLLAAVEAAPLEIEGTTITVNDLRSVLFTSVASRDAVVFLPRLIAELEEGKLDVYARLLDGSLPVRALPAAGPVENPLDPITLEAEDLAERLRAMADEVEQLGAQSERLSRAIQTGESLAVVFAGDLVATTERLGWNDQLRIGGALISVTASAPSREILMQLIAQLPESEQGYFQGVLAIMAEEDIVEVHGLLQDPAYRIHPQNETQHALIHCNDRLSFHDISATVDNLRAFDAPQLIDPGYIDFSFAAICNQYGIEQPAGSAPPFVENSTGIPILVSNGALDKATSAIWGAEVYPSLGNAQMVTFPNSEHGASVDSDCAKDVINAFFLDPSGSLNVSCIETLRPVFVAPDAALPAPAA